MKKPVVLSAIGAIVVALVVLALIGNKPSSSSPTNSGTQAASVTEAKDTVMDQLNLSSQQRSSLKKIITSAQPKLRQYAEELRVIKLQMDAVSTGDNYDPAKIKTLANQQAQLMAEMIIVRTQIQHDIYNLLTPEQKQKLKAIQSGMMGSSQTGQ